MSTQQIIDGWEKGVEPYTENDVVCFNGDRLHHLIDEKLNRRATIYHRRLSGEIETLIGTITGVSPEGLRLRWHDWCSGVTREHWLNGSAIENWIIGSVPTS